MPLALFRNRAFLVAVGLLLLALIIWFAGPYFAFGTLKPLETVVERLIAILVMVSLMLSTSNCAKLATPVTTSGWPKRSRDKQAHRRMRKVRARLRAKPLI